MGEEVYLLKRDAELLRSEVKHLKSELEEANRTIVQIHASRSGFAKKLDETLDENSALKELVREMLEIDKHSGAFYAEQMGGWMEKAKALIGGDE